MHCSPGVPRGTTCARRGVDDLDLQRAGARGRRSRRASRAGRRASSASRRGDVSVMPQTMVTSPMCIRVCTCFITSTGHGAPAMIPVRSDDRSNSREPRVIQLRDEHRRHAVERRAALGLHRFEHRERRRTIRRARRCTRRGSCSRGCRAPCRSSGRTAPGRTRGRARCSASAAAGEVGVVEDVVVRERRALREPGRAGRVLDVDRVVELQRRSRRRRAARRSRCARRRRGARPSRESSTSASRSCGQRSRTSARIAR